MTGRERVLAAIDRKPVDRIPSDLWATPDVYRALKAHFHTDDQFEVWDKLGVDGVFRTGPKYIGKDRTLPDGTQTEIWGIQYKEEIDPDASEPEYWEQTVFPLQDFTDPKQLDDFNWENPADYDYDGLAAECREMSKKYAIMVGGVAPFFDLWNLFGQEQILVNLALRRELVEATLEHVCDYRHEQLRLICEATKGCADITGLSDDFGSQKGLVMSIDMIRHFFWPHYRRCAKLAKSYGLRLFHHDDGAIRDLIPDLIDIGIDILNPIQRRCVGMEVEGLKRDFGKQLSFHGAVDNQHVLPFGTPDEVREEVRNDLATLGSDGTGYVIAPCHCIPAGTPVDNVLAMYDEILKQG